MHQLPVSCFIIAKNEADRIAHAIQSVRPLVDEVVIVVDNSTTDHTAAVAASEGCRVVTQPWLGFGAQKRFAEDQCRNDWVLNIDADEVITGELQREIIGAFGNGSPRFVAYGMPLRVVYPSATRPRPWARDNWYVRLYDRRRVRFRDSFVHDTVVTGDHEVGRFQAPIHHYSIRSFGDMRRKLEERMALAIRYANKPSMAKLMPRLFIELPMHFFKYYIVRRHITGGLTGLQYAFIQARYRQRKIYQMWLNRLWRGEQRAFSEKRPQSADFFDQSDDSESDRVAGGSGSADDAAFVCLAAIPNRYSGERKVGHI